MDFGGLKICGNQFKSFEGDVLKLECGDVCMTPSNQERLGLFLGEVKWLSCVRLCDRLDLKPTRLLCPWDFPGKNTGVGCHFLRQEIFPTQGSNPGLPHCRQTLCLWKSPFFHFHPAPYSSLSLFPFLPYGPSPTLVTNFDVLTLHFLLSTFHYSVI